MQINDKVQQALQETFGGLVQPYDPTKIIGLDHIPAPGVRKQLKPKSPLFETPIDPWQHKLTKMVKDRKTNIIVNVSPSGGKTSPIMRAWVELVTEAHKTGKPIPKLLFVGKTRQLALQLFMDVRKVIEKLVLDRILLPGITPPTFDPRSMNILKERINELVIVDTGGGGSTVYGAGKISPATIAVTATIPKAKEIIQKYDFRLIVIDELQEYLSKPGEKIMFQSESDVKDMIELVKRGSTPKNTIVMLTGSLNAVTTRSLARWLGLISKGKFTPIFESVANRSYIKVFPNHRMKKANDLIKIAENIINHKQKNSLLILFSVGDPSKSGTKAHKNILSISNQLLKSIPKKAPEAITGQKAKYKTDLQQRDIEYGKTLPGAMSKLPRSDTDELNDMIQGYSVVNGVQIPRDQFLGQCLLRGFGYIAGGKARIKQMGFDPENRDTLLVQKLFKDGRINLLIATNAVGVGSNLKVRQLFIPSLLKFSGLQIEPIDTSSLIQLIHRAGRDPKESAIIYCDEDDIGRINHLINQSNTYEAVPQVDIRNVKKHILLMLAKPFLKA